MEPADEKSVPELVRPRLRFDFYRAGPIAAVLRSVIRCEHLKFSNRVDAWIHVQRGVATVVHVVAAVQFPIVVFDAAAVHAVADVAVDAYGSLILSGLVTHSWGQRD